MSSKQLVTLNFMRGLVDTPDEDGLPFPSWTQFHDIRVADGGAKRRKGMVRIARAGNDMEAIDLNGSSQYLSCPVDTRIHARMHTHFTIEGLFSLDSVTGTQGIIRYGTSAYSFYVYANGTTLTAEIVDDTPTTTTLTSTTTLQTGTTYSFQVVRSGADVTLRVDNVVEDTDTMSATNSLRTPVSVVRFGLGGGSEYLNGQLDYIRIFSVARSGHPDDRMRFPDPRADFVLADYDFDLDSNDLARDRSRYGNTALATGSPSTTTALAIQTAPVTCIHGYQNDDGVRRAFVAAGEYVYDAEV